MSDIVSMSDIFFDYRKRKIWGHVTIFLKACGYEDWDQEIRKTRIHTLTSVVRTHLDSK